MRLLVQRVQSGAVTINQKERRAIGPGFVVLVGVTHSDTLKDAEVLAEKCAHLRVFEDDHGKMNLSLLETSCTALVISQFTLYGDTQKGRRPNFTEAARPEIAIPVYEHFIASLCAQGISVTTGEFGADMLVEIMNDGPVTISLEYPVVS